MLNVLTFNNINFTKAFCDCQAIFMLIFKFLWFFHSFLRLKIKKIHWKNCINFLCFFSFVLLSLKKSKAIRVLYSIQIINYKLTPTISGGDKLMEKSLFAVAGVATLAAVAMPVAGVLADTMTVKDSLTVTVGSSCTLASIMSKKRMRLAIYIIYI